MPDPRFTFGYFIAPAETRVGPQRTRFGIAQTFPWFGKLELKGDMATDEANALKAQYDALKLKLSYEMKNDFYEYEFLTKPVEITRENMELLRFMESPFSPCSPWKLQRASFSSPWPLPRLLP